MPLQAGACSYSKLDFNLHENTRRNHQSIKRVDRAGSGFEDINDAFMRPHLELLARFLIDVRATQHRVALDTGRDGDWATDPGVRPLGVVDDLLRRRIQGP